MSTAQKTLSQLAESAGIEINGSQPWDIQVHDNRVFDRILHQGSLGFGEAYMDSWWDCKALDQLICKIGQHNLIAKVAQNYASLIQLFFAKANIFKAMLINQQSKQRAREVGEKHYDIGNDLYSAMLDKNLVYTCA
jgi:cyclopropane-fatty-acyl-phospholipid synthase